MLPPVLVEIVTKKREKKYLQYLTYLTLCLPVFVCAEEVPVYRYLIQSYLLPILYCLHDL